MFSNIRYSEVLRLSDVFSTDFVGYGQNLTWA